MYYNRAAEARQLEGMQTLIYIYDCIDIRSERQRCRSQVNRVPCLTVQRYMWLQHIICVHIENLAGSSVLFCVAWHQVIYSGMVRMPTHCMAWYKYSKANHLILKQGRQSYILIVQQQVGCRCAGWLCSFVFLLAQISDLVWQSHIRDGRRRHQYRVIISLISDHKRRWITNVGSGYRHNLKISADTVRPFWVYSWVVAV